MKQWLRVSLLLCTFGFFREMRPSEPFATEFLSGDWRNITSEQINKDIYPLGTYSVLAQLVIVFLVTDILRYKPIIILSACAGMVLFAILGWTKSLWELKLGQLFYGTFMASEVAYYTYIYAKVEKDRYQIVTGHTRAAILCGKFLGGALAQVLVSTETMDYRELNFISFGSQVVSLFIAIALPPVKKSLYFYTEEKNEMDEIKNTSNGDVISHPNSSVEAIETKTSEPKFSWRNAFRLLILHTKTAYTNSTVIKWSFWWTLATCGQLQAISYVQFLWKEVDPNNANFYNGAVEATVTIIGAAGAMTAGLLNSSRHKKWHNWILIVGSLLMGSFLILSAISNNIWLTYSMYVLFGAVYYFVITVASSAVAENLSDDSFALIFGINTLVALGLQALLTIVVITDTGFGLEPRPQYVVYGGYFIVLAGLYCASVLITFVYRICRSKSKDVME